MQNNKKLEKDFQKLSEAAKEKIAHYQNLSPISLSTLLKMEFPENEWLVEKLIPRNCITIISGYAGSFKTWMALQIAISTAKEENLFGTFPCSKTSTLIIDEENYIRELYKRFNALSADSNLPIYIMNQKNFKLTDDVELRTILEICKDKNIGLIIMDSLVRMHDRDENDAKQMAEVFSFIKKLCKAGISVVLLHHERKDMSGYTSQRMRGSSDIYAAIDSHISIRKDKDCPEKITLEQTKLRCAKEVKPFELIVEENDDRFSFRYVGQEQGKNKWEIISNEIKDILSGGERMSKQDIVEKVKQENDFGEKAVKNVLNHMITKGELREEKGLKNTKICCLVDNEDKLI